MSYDDQEIEKFIEDALESRFNRKIYRENKKTFAQKLTEFLVDPKSLQNNRGVSLDDLVFEDLHKGFSYTPTHSLFSSTLSFPYFNKIYDEASDNSNDIGNILNAPSNFVRENILPLLRSYFLIFLKYRSNAKEFEQLHLYFNKLFKNSKAADYVLKNILAHNRNDSWFKHYLSNFAQTLEEPYDEILQAGLRLTQLASKLNIDYRILLGGLASLDYNVDKLILMYKQSIKEISSNYDRFFARPIAYAIKGSLLETAFLTLVGYYEDVYQNIVGASSK